ncbi:MAG: 4-(cytidine 5'-diphospho)-2-C-methyl-D-erythritol kinase [Candidatus Omnitrophica bacterium]|nr:4-(cytidine 5'-diphospho)-2-C-methyl-D-erythritol kinase [Candidatus Omnitrophota bacterium]
MPSITLLAPAKLNLVLDVLGKRPDGFHELRTVFERIGLCDTITLTANPHGPIRVTCDHPHVPKGPRNLAFRAARQIQQEYGVRQGVDIRIVKRIPVAAGLAGGSSNAAAVLMGVNRLWRLHLSQKRLARHAVRLGSDVAFFMYDTPFALGTGRGEKIRPLRARTKLWHVLVTPKVKMYTKEVFARLTRKAKSLKLTKKRDNVNICLPYLRKGDFQGLGAVLSNDLEPSILSLRPDLVRLKKKLSDAGAAGVCFSGSGPSVFALASGRAQAESIKDGFDKRFTQVFVVPTL